MPLPQIQDQSSPPWPVDFIATDMDGTLTLAEAFTPDLLQVLLDLQRAGVTVVITTGRSAGWVQGLLHYLPVAGAIAENGGLFYAPHLPPAGVLLTQFASRTTHRQQLAQVFTQLQAEFPELEPAADNAFRITDWTYDNPGFSTEHLAKMADICQQDGWGFTYSTVQCHIKPAGQNKQTGLVQVLQQHLPVPRQPAQVITVGDSPNDVDLFDPDVFPYSVGVANVAHYLDAMAHQPAVVTAAAELQGFAELASWVLQAKHQQSTTTNNGMGATASQFGGL